MCADIPGATDDLGTVAGAECSDEHAATGFLRLLDQRADRVLIQVAHGSHEPVITGAGRQVGEKHLRLRDIAGQKRPHSHRRSVAQVEAPTTRTSAPGSCHRGLRNSLGQRKIEIDRSHCLNPPRRNAGCQNRCRDAQCASRVTYPPVRACPRRSARALATSRFASFSPLLRRRCRDLVAPRDRGGVLVERSGGGKPEWLESRAAQMMIGNAPSPVRAARRIWVAEFW